MKLDLTSQKFSSNQILKHLCLWHIAWKPSLRSNDLPFIPDSYRIPTVDDYLIDLDCPVEASFYQPTHREIDGLALPKLPVILED